MSYKPDNYNSDLDLEADESGFLAKFRNYLTPILISATVVGGLGLAMKEPLKHVFDRINNSMHKAASTDASPYQTQERR